MSDRRRSTDPTEKDPDSDRLQRTVHRYGSFSLSLPPAITPDSLDADLGGLSWLQVGLVIDPRDFDRDPRQIARHFDAYIAWVMGRTGDHITLYGKDIADAVAASADPVLLPLWRELA